MRKPNTSIPTHTQMYTLTYILHKSGRKSSCRHVQYYWEKTRGYLFVSV